MTENELKALARDCYAALSASMPAVTSPAWAMWAEMCQGVPFQASAWIRAKVIEFDAMPRNFGKAVLNLGREWRAMNGITQAQRACCPDCDKAFPGFFFAWNRNEQGILYERLIRCMCNNDPNEKGPKKSKAQAVLEGLQVIPRGYVGGYAKFMNTVILADAEPRENDLGGVMEAVASDPARIERMRPDHREQLFQAGGFES